jgi:hypothetical protein
LSQLVSVASGYGATQYDTKIPSLGDAASIVEAFKLYHYGRDNYDGSQAPASNSIEAHLINLKSLIDQKISISSASTTYATKLSPTITGTVNFLSASVMFTSASVSGLDAFPSQPGNANKFLTTDGTTVRWSEVPSAFDAVFLLGGM